MSEINQELTVLKTVKLFINGEFPRTESGRTFPVYNTNKKLYAQLCQASKKDLRAATEAAIHGQKAWAAKTAYNRAQILYRMAEMMEGKRAELQNILINVLGQSEKEAIGSVSSSVQSLIYYAGFADKFSQVTASVNPVSGPFHNFTTPEPVGVVGLIYDNKFSLSQWMSQVAAIICSGNSVVVVFEEGAALLSELGEIFKTSDLPAGVINLLSGKVSELYKPMGEHMEILSLLYSGENSERLFEIKELAVDNMKRVIHWNFKQTDLDPIMAFTEAKTVWHPVGL